MGVAADDLAIATTADAIVEALKPFHAAHEADAAERLVVGLRVVRPDEDDMRLREAAEWTGAVDVRATNAAARETLRSELVQALALEPAARKWRVAALVAAERARLAEPVGVILLQPALDMLEHVAPGAA